MHLVALSRPYRLHLRAEKVNRTASLRQSLTRPGILLGPCCHDALTAKLIENAQFPYTFMSGFCTSAAKLAAPDAGLLTYSEMVQTGRHIHEATSQIPVIGDGDTGYGNPLNVKRTVQGYASAGFAGILIEDQVWPKSCGHVKEKRVVDREEALSRVLAAVEARETGDDILIVARTDARQAVSYEEALYRVQAFADAGADILFIDALTSVQEMEGFCSLVPFVPKLANMLEGGGKTPILSPAELERIGFKLAAYPLSLLGVSIKAMERALTYLKQGQVPDLDFQEIQGILGFNEYFEERDGYLAKAQEILKKRERRDESSEAKVSSETRDTVQGRNGIKGPETLEADAVFPPEVSTASVVVAEQETESEEEQQKTRATFARIVVTNTRTGEVKLDTRIPIGFMQEISKFVPEMEGFDLRGILDKTKTVSDSPVFTFSEKKTRTEIYLE